MGVDCCWWQMSGGNCLGRNCPGGRCPVAVAWVEIVQVAVVWVAVALELIAVSSNNLTAAFVVSFIVTVFVPDIEGDAE